MAQKLLQALREQAPRKTGLTFCLTYVKRGSEYFFPLASVLFYGRNLKSAWGSPVFSPLKICRSFNMQRTPPPFVVEQFFVTSSRSLRGKKGKKTSSRKIRCD
jgi:hypothetical protein